MNGVEGLSWKHLLTSLCTQQQLDKWLCGRSQTCWKCWMPLQVFLHQEPLGGRFLEIRRYWTWATTTSQTNVNAQNCCIVTPMKTRWTNESAKQKLASKWLKLLLPNYNNFTRLCRDVAVEPCRWVKPAVLNVTWAALERHQAIKAMRWATTECRGVIKRRVGGGWTHWEITQRLQWLPTNSILEDRSSSLAFSAPQTLHLCWKRWWLVGEQTWSKSQNRRAGSWLAGRRLFWRANFCVCFFS